MKIKISAVIITRNEEENIAGCMKNLSFADEIVVIDNRSKDKTVSIARDLGAKVYEASGLDFSYLRNIGKEKARNKWLLYVDADEKVTQDLLREIKRAVMKEEIFSAFEIYRRNYFFGKIWPKEERVTRLIRKDSLLSWQGSLHESPIITGKVGQLESRLLHYTHRDITSMVKKTNEWSEIEAQLRYKDGHPTMTWWRFLSVMFFSFWSSYIRNGGWKAGTVGLIESIYQSFSIFITYAKLWEKQNSKVRLP